LQIAKLFARIGVDADTGQVKNFTASLKSSKVAIGAVVTGAALLTRELSKMTNEAMDSARVFRQFEADTGGSAESLQRWQHVAQQTSASGDALKQSIEGLNEAREAIRLGEGDISGFQMLGIDPMQDPIDIINDLRERTQNMAPAMRRRLMEQVGVAGELAEVLELSGDEFERMAEGALIMRDDQIESLDRARAASERSSNAIQFLRDIISGALAPALEEMADRLADFIRQHEDGIIRGVRQGARVLRQFVSMVRRVGSAIFNIIDATVGWQNALMGVVVVLGIMFLPITKMVAALLLLLAVFEDIHGFQTGRKSFIGFLLEEFDGFRDFVMRLTDPIKELFELIGAVFDQDWDRIDDMAGKWRALAVPLRGVVEHLGNVRDLMGDIVDPDINWTEALRNWVTNFYTMIANFWIRAGELIVELGRNAVRGAMDQIMDTFEDSFERLDPRNWFGGGDETSAVPNSLLQGANGGGGTFSITQNITGTGDPQQTGRVAADRLSREIRKATAQGSYIG